MAAEYTRPHQRLDVGGRKLNLFCKGSGDPTVLFEAGGSDWSAIWALVQPGVAKFARACAYDRAGLGYSDGDPGPRTPFAIADDLHKLVRAASLSRPLVLVGHSLGGFNMKLYAALYPDDVAGLILVDPSEERDAERTRGLIVKGWGGAIAAQSELSGHRWLIGAIDRYRGCADAAAKAPLDPKSNFYRRCTDPVRPALGPVIAAERAVVQRTAEYQRAQASELAYSVYGDHQSDSAYAALFKPKMFGSKPIIVLTHVAEDSSDPADVADAAAGLSLHRETASLSAAHCHEMVEKSGHNVEIDRPEVIVDAVHRVIAQLAKRGSTDPRALCQQPQISAK